MSDPAAEPPPLTYADTTAILKRLQGARSRFVLIGGQAVNFWANRYLPRVTDLAAGGPYASKDIDFCGDRNAVRECAERLHGEALFPSGFDPTNSGKVVFIDDAGVKREIDFLANPLGLDAADVARTSVPVKILGADGAPIGVDFRVMHPERCLRSRAANTATLPEYRTAHALGQLRASVVCAREFIRDLVGQSKQRAALKLNERIFDFALRHLHARDVYVNHGIEVFDAVLCHTDLPEKFRTVRYEQMRARLAAQRRKHDRLRAGNTGAAKGEAQA